MDDILSRFLNKLELGEPDQRISNLFKKTQDLEKFNLLKLDEPLVPYENDIIVDQKAKTIFLPGYMRIKIKNIHQINLEGLQADINCDIIFSIFYGSLSNKIVELLKQKVIFLFQKNEPIKIVEINEEEQKNLEIKVVAKNQQIKFTLRKIIKTKIQSDIFWTPFNIINMILSITVQPISYYPWKDYPVISNSPVKGKKSSQNQKNPKQKWTIKINLMDCEENYTKFSFSDNIKYGGFQFASYLTRSFFSNKKVSSIEDFQFQDARQKQKQSLQKFKRNTQRIQECKQKMFKTQQEEDQLQTYKQRLKESFQYAHFNIPMFKVPYQSIVTIFLPLLLLGIINLCIFFQDQTLSDRIGSTASLMIAFVALVPVVRQKIAPNPSITIIQIMVYLQTLACLLAFFHSMSVRTIPDFKLNYNEDGLFLASMIINILIVCILIVMLLLYHYKWKALFSSYPWSKQIQFKRQKWFNSLCYQNFKNLIHKQKNYKSIPQCYD